MFTAAPEIRSQKGSRRVRAAGAKRSAAARRSLSAWDGLPRAARGKNTTQRSAHTLRSERMCADACALMHVR